MRLSTLTGYDDPGLARPVILSTLLSRCVICVPSPATSLRRAHDGWSWPVWSKAGESERLTRPRWAFRSQPADSTLISKPFDYASGGVIRATPLSCSGSLTDPGNSIAFCSTPKSKMWSSTPPRQLFTKLPERLPAPSTGNRFAMGKAGAKRHVGMTFP
jgi:hypothetical protein